MIGRQWRDLFWLFILALGVRVLTAWLLRQPGYTDAYYYAVGARQLYTGQGFTEPFIWNYLDPPASLPHPGYLYWMPLTAILGWLGMVIGGGSFRAMQAPFVLLSAFLPLVAYGIAWDLTGKRKHAILAGLLAVFPGFYAHVFVLPDNFAPFALAGSLCLWAAGRGLRPPLSPPRQRGGPRGGTLWFGLAGLAAGFGHLARADGLLLLCVALLAVIVSLTRKLSPRTHLLPLASCPLPLAPCLLPLASCLLGYLLVMGPWFVRNWHTIGTPLSGAGTRTLFLTNYDNLFSYNQQPTLQAYLAWGWAAIVKSKWDALLLNLQRLWVEDLLVVLLPFTAAGLWRLRRERLLWPFLVYLPLLFLAMTVAFTFPGMRGGLYHSGAALLPFFFAAAGPGLEAVLQAAARRMRNWQARQAWAVFSTALVVIAALVTAFALWRAGILSGAWNDREQGYARIGQWLDAQGAEQAVVMVGNAPGFAWHTGHQAVAVPNDPLDTVVAVADRYGARYLVLDSKRPRTTDRLYAGEVTVEGLELLQEITGGEETWQVYRVGR